jgi:hypothetical protein
MSRILSLLALASVWMPATVRGSDPPPRDAGELPGAFVAILATEARQPAPEAEPIPITIRPAGEPIPALKYRLIPPRKSLVPGNAAIFYHRGIQHVIETRLRLANEASATAAKAPPAERPPSTDERIAKWIAGPIAEIPRAEAEEVLLPFRGALREAEAGASRSFCEWEFELRKEGISLLIPEIQEMRSLARLVSLRARLAILDGDADAAMHWIEVGMTMGRHTGDGPLLIQALVGLAIESMMIDSLRSAIQIPGTPSLCWALVDRPRPFINLRRSLEFEGGVLERELPGVDELDGEPWSLDRARAFVAEMQEKLLLFAAGEPIPGTAGALPSDLSGFANRLGIAAMAAKIYPEARKALVAAGYPEAKVGAMPVVQVAALYTLREYRRLQDDIHKWMNVPYWQSYDRVDRSFPADVEGKLANPLLTLFRMLTPALNSARLADLRVERQLDALQCVEAIRLHAAAHGGRLPESLEAITEAPIPLDPATGKPFAYEADGRAAILSAPIPPGAPKHASYAIRYELKLAD